MPPPNNGPQLKANDQGFYEIHWSENGRSKRRSTRTKDRGLAQKVLANFILLIGDDGIVPEPESEKFVMVRDVMGHPDGPPGPDYWTEHVETSVVAKDSARYSYDKLLPHFGHLAVRDITPAHVASYVEKRKAGTIGRPSVGHTIARELSVLNAAINHARKAKRITKAEQPFIKLPASSPPRERWLSEAEAGRLIAASRGKAKKLPRIFRFIHLAFGTAGRKSAILELRRKQVDMEKGIIYLNPEGRAQTKKKRATIPISDELRPVLAQILNQIPDKDEAFLLDHAGSIRTSFATARRLAKLGKDVTPHTIRHTWATWRAQAGVPLWSIAGVLGDSLETVTKTYAHHCPEYLRDAVNFRGKKPGVTPDRAELVTNNGQQ